MAAKRTAIAETNVVAGISVGPTLKPFVCQLIAVRYYALLVFMRLQLAGLSGFERSTLGAL